MIFRNIKHEDIKEFARQAIGVDDLGSRLLSWINKGITRYELCFLAEDGDRIPCLVVYGCVSGQDDELVLLYLSTTEKSGNVSTLCSLLKESINSVKFIGFHSICCHFYSDNKRFNDYLSALYGLDFKNVQTKRSYVFRCNAGSTESNRLYYKALNDVGEGGFIEAIEAVTESTLDRISCNDILKYGAREAAIRDFAILKKIDYNEAWWRLAYQKNQDFVGLIVPQRLKNCTGVINYIGVVPQKRGNRFCRDLLLEGLSVLKDNGITEVIAEIDEYNVPIEEALLDLSFALSCSMVVLELSLS